MDTDVNLVETRLINMEMGFGSELILNLGKFGTLETRQVGAVVFGPFHGPVGCCIDGVWRGRLGVGVGGFACTLYIKIDI